MAGEFALHQKVAGAISDDEFGFVFKFVAKVFEVAQLFAVTLVGGFSAWLALKILESFTGLLKSNQPLAAVGRIVVGVIAVSIVAGVEQNILKIGI